MLHKTSLILSITFILTFSANAQIFFKDAKKENDSDKIFQPVISSQSLPYKGWNQSDFTSQNFSLAKSALLAKKENINYSSLDTCATYTYRLQIGNSNREETVNEIITIDSGNMLLSGRIKDIGTPYDALLVKLNSNGTVLWAKSYGDPGTHEEFLKARATSDGGIIAIGSSNPDPPGDGWILICKFDNNGIQQWTRRYKSPVAGTLAHGADIVEMADHNFLFIGDNSESVLFGKLTSTGGLTWSKITSPFQTVKAIRILEDYNGHFLTITGTENGFYVSSIFKVSLTDGSLVWNRKFGGAAMNSNCIFHKVEMINLRPRIIGIYAPVGQPYKFIRVTVNTGSNIESIEEYTTPGPAPDITSMSAENPWSQAMAFSATSSSASVNLVRNSPDVSYVDWSCNLNNAAPFSLAGLEKTADAGFIVASNFNNDILLIKTDSIGLNPGCDRVATNTSQTTINPAIPAPGFGIANSIWQENTSLVNEVTVTVDTLYSCKQLTCPPHPNEDTCLSSFYKVYRSYEFSEVGIGITETGDNKILITGVVRSNPYEPLTTKSFLAKMTKKGDLVAKERWLIGTNSTIRKQIKLNDGNILVGGYTTVSGNPGIFLYKLDNNFNIIWNKTYKIPTSGFWYFNDITETSAGEIFLYLFFLDFANLNDRMVLVKLDNSGNQVWQRTYRSSTGISLVGTNGSVVSEGNYVYCNTDVNVNNKYNTLTVKFDKNTGNVIWNKRFVYNNTSTQLDGLMTIKNNRLYLSGSIEYQPNETDPALMRLSSDGAVEKLVIHRRQNSTFQQKIAFTSNADIISSNLLTDFSTNPATLSDFFFRLDSNFNIKYSKKTPTHNYMRTEQLTESAEGDVFVNGSNFYDDPYNADLLVKRYLPNGTLGSCASDSFDFEQIFPAIAVTDYPLNNVSIPAFEALSPIFIRDPFTLQQNKLYCGSISNCDTIWLEGSNIVCDSVNQYTYHARKNPSCAAPVTWVINSPFVQILQSNDSLIRVRFLQNGNIMIRAKIYTGCRWLEDSIAIQVLIAPDTLNLGPDTTLCPTNTHLLNAHSGYLTYLWQDGSSDSTFTVTAPGLYWVEVKDACDNISRDTVIVTAAPPVPLDIGPDLNKCNKDSLTITAPPGFINYIWSPNYNINTTSGPVVIVFPAVDTMYKLKAEKTPGCFAFDSVRITVKLSPPINLGTDTSFCTGDSLLLNAGAGFTNYNWSTGQTTQIISVFATGTYSIIAMAANGCLSKDTLKILNLFKNPVIDLGPDSPICEGVARQLNAGAGFNNYFWNNGSNTQSISVNSTGTYWVIVTDNNNCKGGDTTVITSILPIPENFLPADTVLCSYSSISLKPLSSYSAYLWSTGSNSSSILISQPGNYWLQVVSSNGCSGKDTIKVNPKQCLEGFYIPGAFTPNNDGKNDLFKPLLFGNVLKYEFIIYNRWGEIVFRTKDLQKGWNGKVNGLDADTYIFVWQCNFQFEGKKAESRKGTVALIR